MTRIAIIGTGYVGLTIGACSARLGHEVVCADIDPVLASEAIVVNKSTVPVGSAKVVEHLMKRPDVRVVSNPEFLRPVPGWGGSFRGAHQ